MSASSPTFRDPVEAGSGHAVTLGRTSVRLRPSAGPEPMPTGDIRIDGALGGSRFALRLPSGLLAVALDGGLDLETLVAVEPEDAALVVEHLLGPALAEAERRLGGRIVLERVGFAAEGETPDLDLAGHAYEAAAPEVTFVVMVAAAPRSRLGRLLADDRLLATAATGTGAPSQTGTTDAAPAGPDGQAVALGPLFLDIASLDRLAAGDLLAFGESEALSGGLFGPDAVVPLTLEAGGATVMPGFSRAAAAAARPGEAKLWVECGTARLAATRRLLAGSEIAWDAFGEDAAWLTLDGCRLRVAGGRLVDTGGTVALRIERTRGPAWA